MHFHVCEFHFKYLYLNADLTKLQEEQSKAAEKESTADRTDLTDTSSFASTDIVSSLADDSTTQVL